MKSKKYDHLKAITQNTIIALQNNEISEEEVYNIIAKIKEEIDELDDKKNNNQLDLFIRLFLN